jgi:hypothetical protein
MDSGLGDRHTTLLHHLVDGCTINVRHLVEFIDADYTAISKHHGTSFKPSLT